MKISKILLMTLSLLVLIAFLASPASAIEDETTDPGVTTTDPDVVDEGDSHEDEVRKAAKRAKEKADDFEENGTDDPSDDDELDDAKDSLQDAIDRLSEDGVGGNGVASKVLQALLDGESPAGIGAEHGAEMAEAAATRREERAIEREERREQRVAARDEQQEQRVADREERQEQRVADRKEPGSNRGQANRGRGARP